MGTIGTHYQDLIKFWLRIEACEQCMDDRDQLNQMTPEQVWQVSLLYTQNVVIRLYQKRPYLYFVPGVNYVLHLGAWALLAIAIRRGARDDAVTP